MVSLSRHQVAPFLAGFFSIFTGLTMAPHSEAKISAKRSEKYPDASDTNDKIRRHEDQPKASKAKLGKSIAPVARVPMESRSSKVLEFVGGAAFMDGYPGIMGNTGLFIGPDLVMEAGLFYGMKGRIGQYLDGWVQGKIFVSDYLFVALGAGVGKETISHNETLVADMESWKETATKLRLYAGLGPQFTFHFVTGGLQASVGFGQVMGSIENDLPENDPSAQEKAEESVTIKSGLSYNISVFLGLAL